ncbi:repressor [Halostagnicola larsenii XH-48]|uniref:Repressor n=2 Tax=Halostagnicola larsenii TaxID=353800 RepID=W0JPM2_9EURY|nr:repressor [Halostagnicola larsenii XH-48]
MSKNDDRVLEHLARHGPHRALELRSALADRSATLEFRPMYLQKRLEILADAGLVSYDGLRYELSSQGMAYLEGDLDASTLYREVPE